MQVISYEGEPKTREKLIPGNTPTGISDAVRTIPVAGVGGPDKHAEYYNMIAADLVTNGNMEATT